MDSIDTAFIIFVYCNIHMDINVLKYGLEMKRLKVYLNTYKLEYRNISPYI